MKKMNLFIQQKFEKQTNNIISEIIDLLSKKNTEQLNFILQVLTDQQKEELYKNLLNSVHSNELIQLLCRCSIYSLNIWLKNKSLNEISENSKKNIILYTIRATDLERLKFIENKGIDIVKDYDFFDSSESLSLPLHLVIDETLYYEKISGDKSYRTEMLNYYLSKENVDINMPDKKGKYINDLIHLNVNPEIFEYYIEKGMDINKPLKKEKNILESSLKSILCHVELGNSERINEYTNNIITNIKILNKNNININLNNSEIDIDSGEYDVINLAFKLENECLLKLIFNMYKNNISDKEKQKLIENSFMYNYNFNVVNWLLNDFKPNDNWYSSDMVISCISVLNIFGASLFIPSKFNMDIIVKNLQVIRENKYSIWNTESFPFHLIAKASYNQYIPRIMEILSEMGFDINKKDENGLEAIYLIYNKESNLKDVFLQEKSKIEKTVISEIWEEKESKNSKKRL